MSAAAPAAAGAQMVDAGTANTDFMARSRRFPVRMPLVGGTLNGPYALGSTLNFFVPPVNNGWLDMIELDINLTLTGATATSTPNKAFPWNLISYITVNLDGQISLIDPYWGAYLLPRLKGRLRSDVTNVLAGVADTQVNTILNTVPSGAGSLIVGANVVRFRMRIPLNALHPLDGSGLLPCQGTQDPIQVNVVLPAGLVGVDPLTAPASSATGTLVPAAGSTITMYGWVRDGRTKWSPSEQLPFYPNGLPQVSYDQEPNIVNLQANTLTRGQLTKVLKVYYMASIYIDGQSSTEFSTPNNFNAVDLSADSTGNFEFAAYGLNNVPMDLLWSNIRETFGQDFPNGVIPWVYAPQAHIGEPGVANGTDILNMTAGGWTSMYSGVNFAAQGGVAGSSPRIVTRILGSADSPYIG